MNIYEIDQNESQKLVKFFSSRNLNLELGPLRYTARSDEK